MSDSWLGLGIVVSLLLHVAIVRGVDAYEPARAQRVPDTLEWVALDPPKPESEPEPEPEPEPEEPDAASEHRALSIPQAPPSDSQPASETSQPTPTDTEPIDLTGVTLVAGTGGWAPVGNGARGGPIRAPIRAASARTDAASATAQAGPSIVAVGDLSRPPAPPNLDARLVQRYPEVARRQGTPGSALVRARVLPNGRIDRVGVVDATSPRFARACREVLRGSRWSAPLDRSGNPVATEIRYRCEFRVR